MDSVASNNNLTGLLAILEDINSLGVLIPQPTKDRGRLEEKLRAQRDAFHQNNKHMSAFLIDRIANIIYNKHSDTSSFNEIKERLRKTERLYLEINGSIEQGMREKYLSHHISMFNDQLGMALFEVVQSPRDATLALIIDVERSENNVEGATPQARYSQYINGYNKVPNSKYYNAKAAAENATNILNNPENKKAYSNVDAGIKIALLTAAQLSYDKSVKIMSSSEAYDDIPIKVDYQYIRTDYDINDLFQVSYKLYDLRNRVLSKEDILKKSSNDSFAVLDNVHPRDANNLANSEKIDYVKIRQRFLAMIDETFRTLATDVAKQMSNIYYTRSDDYLQMGGPAEAIESRLRGYLIEQKKFDATLYKLLSPDLVNQLLTLNPSSNIDQKLSARINPLVIRAEHEQVLSVPRTIAIQDKIQYSEANLPQLVEDSINKVVFIKSIGKNGISFGSGFLVSSHGHIVTNHHVVKGNSAILVKLNDGREFSSNVILSDSIVDLALLKIQAENTPYFKFCKFSELKAGQTIIAIGAPHGFEETVSKGIISAKRYMSPTRNAQKILMIQTDAQMTHGNSGGPMINLNGEVVGVNSQTLNVIDPGAPGPLNFAISIDEVLKRFAAAIRK